MVYENLLLNCGGGIISKNDKSEQHAATAAVCIGIGGTGVAALSDLKGKIYQQLNPDNPDDPVPKYEGIQLLAIDSDDGAYKQHGGNRRLSDTEFFSIKKDNLGQLFMDAKGKALIRDSHQLRWMEIDKITALLSPEGAGGVRQIGRYLLFERAASLVNKIQEICTTALRKRNCNSLDVYIFAGISGGTGSGCFLDVCYLVRHVIRTAGWNAKIMGYFFLPDVVTSKPEVAARPGSVAYNNSNGYAAMKELDYLMSLQNANDYFEQNYAAGITVKTQEPPVDMCHLISAQQADGRQITNGFDYGINVASDYAMAYLAKVDTANDAEDESGLTMRGHLANVARGVLSIPRRYGANLSYHILGASNAELPLSQINTYLAIGFMRKFRHAAYRPKDCVTNDVVTRFMTDNRLRVQDVFDDVVSDAPGLDLPQIDPTMLAEEPCCEKGRLPRTWAQAVNGWYAECRGQRQRNSINLNRELVDYSYDRNNDQSLIGRLFRALYKLSAVSKYGPYHAAYLLINNGQDLYAALSGEIEKAENQARAQHIQIADAENWVVQCNQNLIDARRGQRNKAYAAFHDSVLNLANYVNAYEQCVKTKEVLETFRRQVKDLYNGYFHPLRELLDNLYETFEANASYLDTPESKKPNAYTWQILSLADVQPRLDHAVDELDADSMVSRFVEALLYAPDSWRRGDQDKITLFIRNYMLQLFDEETSRSLKEYLADKFPRGKSDPQALVEEIKANIIAKVDQKAVPLFWCDPTYSLDSQEFTFSTSTLSVPQICAEVCSAATQYVEKAASEYTVRKTDIKDRIFALRFVSGIPLFAYHGITKLKDDYDRALNSSAGAGVHLYAVTGRGDDGSGKKDWRNFLPTPMPYSKVRNVDTNLVPNGAKVTELYWKAVSLGIIGQVPSGMENDSAQDASDLHIQNNVAEYAIFTTPEISLKEYTLQDFLDRGEFKSNEHSRVLNELKTAFANLHKFGVNPDCAKVELKNDGDKDSCNPEDVRVDYFIQYPKLQALVRREIQKYEQMEATIKQLETIGDEFTSRDVAMKNFTDLLFYQFLTCENNEGNPDYVRTVTVKCAYENQYNETQEFELSRKGMKYGQYPLYQAFRSYLSLAGIGESNPENLELESHSLKDIQNLQDNLNERVASYVRGKRTEKDYIVPALLDLIWNTNAYNDFVNDTLRHMNEVEKADIARFYSDLRSRITALRNESTSWPRNRTIADLEKMLCGGQQEPAQAQVAQNLPQSLWVLYNGKNLELFPAQSRNYAYDRAVNQWIQLNPQMYIAMNGQWVPIQLDPYGNVIL